MHEFILRDPIVFLVIFFCLVSTTNATAQYRTLDFEINSSGYIDDYTRDEVRYDRKRYSGLVQVGAGLSMLLDEKLVISPKIAFGYALQSYFNNQFSSTPNTVPVMREYIEKNSTLHFVKVGAALSYWFSKPGRGLYAETELQNVIALSARSEEIKQLGPGEVQTIEDDFKDEVRTHVPSLRLGIGFNVPIKRIALFLRLSREIRISTYFNTTDNYTLINPNVAMGFRYLLTNKDQSK